MMPIAIKKGAVQMKLKQITSKREEKRSQAPSGKINNPFRHFPSTAGSLITNLRMFPFSTQPRRVLPLHKTIIPRMHTFAQW